MGPDRPLPAAPPGAGSGFRAGHSFDRTGFSKAAAGLPATLALLALALLALALVCSRPASADFEAGLRAYQAGDHRAAFEEWLSLAEAGDPAAMRNIGHLYRWGHGVPQDYATAADWYRRAADMGLDRAQANLGMLYLAGTGVEADPAQAAYWLSQAAIQGHTVAQYNLAQLYLDGRGVQQSEALALGWLQRAARAGHPGALEQLGQLVATAPPPAPTLERQDVPPQGEGSPPPAGSDPVRSTVADKAAPAQRTAEEGLEVTDEGDKPEILDRLAGIFRSEPAAARVETVPPAVLEPETGLPKNRPPTRAMAPGQDTGGAAVGGDTFRRDAARGGEDGGQRSDAESWVLGLIENVVSEEKPADGMPQASAPPPPAPERASAAGGEAPAEAAAVTPDSSASDPEDPGRPASDRLDPEQAETQSAEALRLYQAGLYAQARALWEGPAEAGIGRAQYMLGWMNESGQGGPADLAMAYYWYNRASLGGDPHGARALADLSVRIPPADREQAETLLRAGR